MRLATLTGLFTVVIVIVWIVFDTPETALSPLSLHSQPTPTAITQLRHYGFLPFWTMTSVNPETTSSLDVVVYFGLQLGAEGLVVTDSAPGEREPGWHRLTNGTWTTWREAWPGNVTELAFRTESDEALHAILTDPDIRHAAVESMTAQAKSFGFTGIQVDFEPAGAVSEAERTGMTSFLADLATRAENLTIGVDVYGRAHESDSLWDIEALSPYVDYFFVMAYDYHRPASIVAGPVAPLYVPDAFFGDHSVVSDLAAIYRSVPSSQLVLGIPLYGYSWEVTEPTAASATIPRSGRLETLVEIATTLPEADPPSWSLPAFSPWTSFNETASTRVVHYENPVSLSLKVDLAREADLAGVGYWALGYVDDYDQFMQTIGHE